MSTDGLLTPEELATRWRLPVDSRGYYKRAVRERCQRLRIRKIAGMGKRVLYRPADVLRAEEINSRGGYL
jgi:hypothetical protein